MTDDLPGLPELTLADYVLVRRDVLAEYVRDREQRAVMQVRAEYDAQPLMTVMQVAKRLAVSPQTVKRLVVSGELRAMAVAGGSRLLRFRREDVEAFVSGSRQPSAVSSQPAIAHRRPGHLMSREEFARYMSERGGNGS